MYDKYELKICDSIPIACSFNDHFMSFYCKNENEYCFNWKDSSTMVRRKLVAQNKGFSIQIVNYVMLLMLLKRYGCVRRHFAIKYP